jgi:hypothetical protein
MLNMSSVHAVSKTNACDGYMVTGEHSPHAVAGFVLAAARGRRIFF